MKKKVIAALLLAVCWLGFSATSYAVSGAGAINLVFPIGARFNALGEAGVALAQDATAIWWNPGGLAFLADREQPKDIHIMQSPLAEGLADDINLYWLGYAQPWGAGVFGSALNYLSMGEQLRTLEGGEEGGTFKSNMFAFSVAYGFKMTSNLGVGMAAKYFRDNLAPDDFTKDQQPGSGSGYAFAVDFGALWKVPHLRSNFALAICNLGQNITHADAAQADPMPRKVTAGVAFSLHDSESASMLFVFDYLVPMLKWNGRGYGWGLEWDENEWGVGGEWSYVHSLFFRVGYKSAEAGDIGDYTWGFGLDLQQWVNQGIAFDFAQVPLARGLDDVKRFSIAFRF